MIILCVSLSFTCGFFLGRNLNHNQIQLADPPKNSTEKQENQTATGSAALIDINTATAQQLQTLPGIGATLAGRIVDHRNQHGPFSSPAELLDVEGIGQGRLSAILDYITTGG